MPIVIMKSHPSPLFFASDSAHAIFEGTFKEAVEMCKEHNKKPNTKFWKAVRVPTMKTGGK